MSFPEYFSQAPSITVYDGLAKLLGASSDGLLHYEYRDAVKLAGHSCPTVAGAWLMTILGLQAIYHNENPVRGEIIVRFADSANSGVTGVIANVACLVTGATSDTGFKGLAGQHDRRNLLFFDADIPGELSFTRRDTGASVAASFNAQSIPGQPETMMLLQKSLAGRATAAEQEIFAKLWQERVARILTAAAPGDVVKLNSF